MKMLLIGLVVMGLLVLINEKLREKRREKVLRKYKRIKELEDNWLRYKIGYDESKWEGDMFMEEFYIRSLNEVEEELRELGKEV